MRMGRWKGVTGREGLKKRKKREEGKRASLPNTAQAGKGQGKGENMPLGLVSCPPSRLENNKKKQSDSRKFENRLSPDPMELQLALTGMCDWLSLGISYKRSPSLRRFRNSYLPGWSILWSRRGDVLGRESALHSADGLSSEWPSGHLDSFIFICGVYAVRGVGPFISFINSKIPACHM